MAQHVADRLTATGPKRMLALDGGGVRGMITIGFLERIEQVLRQRHGRNDYVLADYFDMIGGTSVGSILATMLALGWPISRVRSEFCNAADDIFRCTPTRWGLLRPKFSDRRLRKHAHRILGDMRLDARIDIGEGADGAGNGAGGDLGMGILQAAAGAVDGVRIELYNSWCQPVFPQGIADLPSRRAVPDDDDGRMLFFLFICGLLGAFGFALRQSAKYRVGQRQRIADQIRCCKQG